MKDLNDKSDLPMDVLKLKYGGDLHSIDATTYINSLIQFTTVVQEINKDLDPDKKLDVRINANKEGSFVVDILFVAQDVIGQLRSVFTIDNAHYLTQVTSAITGFYKVAQFLKGKKPKAVVENNDGKVTIQNNENATIVINNGIQVAKA